MLHPYSAVTDSRPKKPFRERHITPMSTWVSDNHIKVTNTPLLNYVTTAIAIQQSGHGCPSNRVDTEYAAAVA